MLGASKKLLSVRRAEVLGSGLGSLAGRLVHLCTEEAEQLLRHPVGSSVLVEVAMGGEGGMDFRTTLCLSRYLSSISGSALA